MKVLFAITTANQLDYTIKIIESLNKCNLNFIEVIIFDDASNDGTVDWCNKNNIQIVTKITSKGLTHSWNLAYKKFKSGDYTHLILANNDLIIPSGAIEKLIISNDSFVIVGPLSTKKGVGHQPLQDVKAYYDVKLDEYNFKNTQDVQNEILKHQLEQNFKQVDFVNGFIFSMNRKIIDFEISDGNLFEPKNINVGNESELCERVKPNIGIVLNSYIFHFKGVSFQDFNFDKQDIAYNIYRDLKWQEAKQLKKSVIRRLFFKLKRRIK
jgi:GT2 family glycosyltransferase